MQQHLSTQSDVIKQGGLSLSKMARRSQRGQYDGDSSNEDSSDERYDIKTCTKWKSSLATVPMQIRNIIKAAKDSYALRPGSYTLTYDMGIGASQLGALSYWFRTEELGISLSVAAPAALAITEGGAPQHVVREMRMSGSSVRGAGKLSDTPST